MRTPLQPSFSAATAHAQTRCFSILGWKLGESGAGLATSDAEAMLLRGVRSGAGESGGGGRIARGGCAGKGGSLADGGVRSLTRRRTATATSAPATRRRTDDQAGIAERAARLIERAPHAAKVACEVERPLVEVAGREHADAVPRRDGDVVRRLGDHLAARRGLACLAVAAGRGRYLGARLRGARFRHAQPAALNMLRVKGLESCRTCAWRGKHGSGTGAAAHCARKQSARADARLAP